jgi:hypothetical protein
MELKSKPFYPEMRPTLEVGRFDSIPPNLSTLFLSPSHQSPLFVGQMWLRLHTGGQGKSSSVWEKISTPTTSASGSIFFRNQL